MHRWLQAYRARGLETQAVYVLGYIPAQRAKGLFLHELASVVDDVALERPIIRNIRLRKKKEANQSN
jgi:hypothetical protein